VTLTCNSCNEKNKGAVSGGFATTTVNYTWSANLPSGLGSISGGGSEEVSGGATLNCADCSHISAPHTKYNVDVTLSIPYTLKSITGFPTSSFITIFYPF
jgi:hypothetical protein